MSNLKEVVQNLDYIKKKDETGKKLYWIRKEWESDKFRSFLDNIDANLNKGSKVYDKRNLLVRLKKNETLGIKKDIAIKKFKLIRRYDKIRFLFINSKAIRSLKIALALENAGVKTPKAIAVVEKRGSFNQIIYSYYITEYIDYDYSLTDIEKNKDNHSFENMEEFLPNLAKDLARMHNFGIIHKDLHLGNILVKKSDASFDFYYIDINCARIKKSLNKKQKIKDYLG